MRVLLRLSKNKSALSNMVAYVLLISITIGLSVLVYNWLSFYVGDDDVKDCSEGVGVIMNSYECRLTNSFGDGSLKVVLKNKGRFTIDGFIFRVHDRLGADFGVYVLDDVGVAIAPGKDYETTYEFKDYDFNGHELKTVTMVEVQPFLDDGENINCEPYISQDISCYGLIAPE